MSAYMKSKYLKFKHMIKSLRYIIPAIVGHEVGLANLEAEVYEPKLLEEIAAPVYIYNAGLPCKPCRVIIKHRVTP